MLEEYPSILFSGLGVTGGQGSVGSSGIFKNWSQFENDLLFSFQFSKNIFIYSVEGIHELQ